MSGTAPPTARVSNLLDSDAATYRVVITNLLSGSTNASATLTVNHIPLVATQPQSCSLMLGGNGQLSISASSSAGPLKYQWHRNSVAVSGATGSALTFTGAQLSQAGIYSVVLSNAAGLTQSLLAA